MSIPAVLGTRCLRATIRDQFEISDRVVLDELAHLHNPRQGSTERRNMVAIAVKTLADRTRISERTVTTSLARLESLGLIKVHARYIHGRIRTFNDYELTFRFIYEKGDWEEEIQQSRFELSADQYEFRFDETVSQKPIAERDATVSPGGATVAEHIRNNNKKESKTLVGLPSDELFELRDFIWRTVSKTSRLRSSKANLEAAIQAQIKRGHSRETIARGVAGYVLSRDARKDDGAYQKGAHRILTSGIYLSNLDNAPERVSIAADEPVEDWPVEIQERRMQAYAHSQPWNPEFGPRPGELGCKISDEIQRKHGWEPARMTKAPKPVPIPVIDLDEEVID